MMELLQKQLKAKSHELFLQKVPWYLFERVLITPLEFFFPFFFFVGKNICYVINTLR